MKEQRPLMSLRFRLVSAGILLAVILIMGTTGFSLIEGWNPLYAFYVTVITATTVAFVDPRPLSASGQVFNVFLAVFSVIAFLYVLSIVLQLVVEGELGFAWSAQRMRRRVAALRRHHILCGYGRAGREIAAEFKERRVPFVVIETTPESLEALRSDGHLFVEGDPAVDRTLEEAGIDHALTLLAASDSDSQNTYITLAAKTLHPDVLVVARVGQPYNEAKLVRASADRVISPYRLAGRRMALAALQPLVGDFLDTVAGLGAGSQLLTQVPVTAASPLEGKTLDEISGLSPGLVVLGVLREQEAVVVRPTAGETVREGDVLLILGVEQRITALGAVNRGPD